MSLARGAMARALAPRWPPALAAGARARRAQSSTTDDFGAETTPHSGTATTRRSTSPSQLKFGPYRPDVDSEFDAAQVRTPYEDYFGDGRHLMTQLEFD